jgi:MFS transporter, DHA2 family, multidrug resistance protein
MRMPGVRIGHADRHHIDRSLRFPRRNLRGAHMTAFADQRLTGWRFLLFNAVLATGNVIALSNVPGYTVLVPYAAGGLQGVNPSFGTWATTDHMMGIVLGLPIARWLSGRYGDWRVYVAAFIAYAIMSLACAWSETIWFFVPARFLLGLAGGVILPLGQGLALNEIPERFRSYGVAWWAMLSMAPFTLGVFMGGFWAEYFNWRMLFYSNIFLGLPIAGAVGALLYGRSHRRRVTRFDFVGFFLIAVVLVGTQTILNQGNDFDWMGSPILSIVLVLVIVALPTFVFWEMGERNPVLDIRLFGHRNYAVATFCSVAGFLVIQGTLSVFVGQLQTLLGYTSSLAGVVYLSMALLAVPLVAVVHLLVKKVDLRYFASLNFIGFAATLTWLGQYDKLASFDQITTPMIFFGFFLATFFAPPAAIAVQGLAGRRLIRAAEELAMLRTAFGAYGITSQAVVQFRRAPFHQLTLADHLGGRRFPSLDLLPQLMDRLQATGMNEAAARGQVARLMRQQSLLLGLDDAFYFGALVFVGLAALVWLARPAPLEKKPEPKPSLEELEAEELME